MTQSNTLGRPAPCTGRSASVRGGGRGLLGRGLRSRSPGDGLSVRSDSDAAMCCDGAMATNVLGTELQTCSTDPLTGFYRNGCCDTGGEDAGVHTVCARVTVEFLAFSAEVGNDLSTPHPEFGFAGLSPGDQWCLCASRWAEALEADAAPQVVLEATHARTLEWVDLADLKRHAVAE